MAVEAPSRRILKCPAMKPWLEQLAGYPLVDHVLPAISESVPVVNITRRRSLRSVGVMGLRPEDIQVLSQEEISDASGQPLALEALGEYEVYLNASAAEDLGAAPGDVLDLYSGSRPKQYTVRAHRSPRGKSAPAD